jgi:NAD(P)-dependent dehydrogenase (short-subunit alcohol dehydrogenase family)
MIKTRSNSTPLPARLCYSTFTHQQHVYSFIYPPSKINPLTPSSAMSFLYSQLFVTPPYPTTDFTNQTVIVTGANVGLGLEAARHFTRLNAAKVILAVRSVSKGEAAKKSIESTTKRTGIVEVWPLDLASYASVKAFAAKAAELPRLDAVVENAGLAVSEWSMVEDNELTITVNVISTMLLAILLLPALRRSAKEFNTVPRLSIVTSAIHHRTNLPQWKTENTFETLNNKTEQSLKTRYPESKLLEVFAVRELVTHMSSTEPLVVVNMVNPGLCHSELARNAGWGLWLLKLVLARTTEVGSRTLVHGASSGKDSHGQYMDDGQVHDDRVSAFVKSEEGQKAQKKIWKELGEKLDKIQPGIMQSI